MIALDELTSLHYHGLSYAGQSLCDGGDMSTPDYVHGYSEREAIRLGDQATTLSGLLHHDTIYPPGSRVLESGCGTGEQTLILARNNPEVRLVSIDISPESLAKAEARITDAGITSVKFQKADIYALPFPESSFDHVFVCFVLEHLPDPAGALRRLIEVLKPGGTLTTIEGDHGSWYCYPHSEAASRAVQCLIAVQASLGGDSLIGRQLYPLLCEAGLQDVRVSPRMVYVDSSKPELVEGFSKNTFIAMVEGAREQALAMNLVDEATWDRGITDLYRATEADGTFCYTFFKGVGVKG
jgi:SAM-dependent methyltransferase